MQTKIKNLLAIVAALALFSFSVIASAGDKYPKADTPAKAVALLEKHFEDDDVEAVLSLYAENSLYVLPPSGEPIVGLDGIRKLVQNFEDTGRNTTLSLRYSHQNGDIALVIVDWRMESKDENGIYQWKEGTAVDVLKKDKNGHWYYFIDNPFGAADTFGAGHAGSK